VAWAAVAALIAAGSNGAALHLQVAGNGSPR
jgi:hypothetical protein